MSNTEPPFSLLKWKDVVAWEPRVTFYKMRKWREAKVIKPLYVRGTKSPYYHKRELKRAFAIGLE